MNEDPRFYACIMAGGSGERFWPMSRQRTPKQLTKLFGETTLIEDTVRRLEGVVRRENIFVLTNKVQLEAARAALPMLKAEQIVAEPAKRDTAPAAALAVALVRSRDPQGVMAVLSSDALIHDGGCCGRQIGAALARAATTNALLTFGIPPAFASTGFGYLEMGDEVGRGADGSVFRRVKRFVEKPDAPTAQDYVESKRYLWNAGMFVWRVDAFLAEADRNAPGLAKFIREFPAAHPSAGSGQKASPGARTAAELYVEERFPTLEPKVSLDYAIMEKAAAVETVIAEFDWDDVGLWTALPKHLPPDPSGNTIRGAVSVVASTNNIVVSNGRMIALCGVKDLVIVETADAILVCHRDAVQDIKQLIPKLPKSFCEIGYPRIGQDIILAKVARLNKVGPMTRDQVLIALDEGIPFAVNMADGRQYRVTDRHQVAVGPTRIVVIDEKGLAHVLPLPTMTGISYLATGN